MDASIVDLRYKTKEVLRALDRNEEVRILYRGRTKGRIVPEHDVDPSIKAASHPFFGSNKESESVDDPMESLRGGRY